MDLKRHFNNPAKLIEKNGKKYIQMTGNGGKSIDSLIFNDQKVIIGDIAEDGSYTLQFEVTKPLSKKTDFKMIIDTGMPSLGKNGIMTHTTKMWFGEENASEINPEANPESNTEVKIETKIENINFKTIKKRDSSLYKDKSKVQQKGKEGSKEVTYEVTYSNGKEIKRNIKNEKVTQKPIDKILLEGTKEVAEVKSPTDKSYSINYTIMHENGKDISSADSFFEKPGTLIEKNNVLYAQFTINNGEMVKQLKTKHGNVDTIKKNKNGSIVVQFKVNKNLSDMDLKMTIEVPGLYKDEHDAILVFEKESKKEIKENKKHRKTLKIGEEKPNLKGKESNNDSENIRGNKSTETTKDKSDSLVPDKAYKINYKIKHEDGINDSLANQFFKNQGVLLEKNGKMYLQMAIMNGEMVRDLVGKYGEAIVVKKTKDGSTVVQLRVDNNLENMPLQMHVIVPEGAIPGFPGYNEEHNALLVFDKNTKQEIAIGDLMLAAISGNENGPEADKSTGTRMGNGSKTNSEKENKSNNKSSSKLGSNNADEIIASLSNGGPDKPEFGLNDNGGLNDKGKSTNPQTGDLTNIWLYAFLLAGSLLILGVKFRRRTI